MTAAADVAAQIKNMFAVVEQNRIETAALVEKAIAANAACKKDHAIAMQKIHECIEWMRGRSK